MSIQYITPSKRCFGAAPLGNRFRDVPEAEALGTVEAAWKDGIRYFDNAPFYGAGLAEIRMGEALAGKPRDEYVISTKVGRVILDEVEDVSARDLGEKSGVFQHGRPNKVVNDYSADATLRSLEDSLKRLKTDRIEIVRSEEHTSERQSLMRISYAVFCLKKKKSNNTLTNKIQHCQVRKQQTLRTNK